MTERKLTIPATWKAIFRILLKAAGLFILLNVVFALWRPQETLGSLSLYNTVLPGRLRLPYGEIPAESYNLSLNNIPAMMAGHVVSQPKPAGEFRIIILGDSGTWGWLLENEATLAGKINDRALVTEDGRRMVAYNLGYPIMALTKDLLLLDAAMTYQPDLILWPVTLESFPRDKQLVPPLVQKNASRLRALIDAYDLDLDKEDERLVDPTFLERTIVGQRRELADLLRLQLYGFSWAATGVDQAYPDEVTLRKTDFEPDVSWGDFDGPAPLTGADLALDVLSAGVARSGDVPVLIVNEPIFISDGENSDLRYNAWYPRWAYDTYRELLAAEAESAGWDYVDLWNNIDPAEFTDSPVHLTPVGVEQLVDEIMPLLLAVSGGRAIEDGE